MRDPSSRAVSEDTFSREAARAATYPPPYPEGWYVVARDRDVGDRPRRIHCVGNDIVLFRGSEGRVHAIAAHCPHMGADLADGRVRDGCLECPFHGWRFSGDGQVAGLPDGETPRPGQRTVSWAVDELHGWVCIYHRHGAIGRGPPPKPRYQLQHVAEIDSGTLLHRGDYDAGQVRMHLMEFAENSVDFPHFAGIHQQLRIPWTNIPIPAIKIRHEASWRTDDSEPHVAWFEDDAQLLFRDKAIPGSGAHAEIRIDGPGGVVRFDFDLGGHGRVVMFQGHTPIAPLLQHVRFRWFSERRVPKLLASYVVGNWVSQWRQDISIWEGKIYQDRPLLTKRDGPVMQLRDWYAQFYPESMSAEASDLES